MLDCQSGPLTTMKEGVHMRLEGAPVPIARDAGGHVGGLVEVGLQTARILAILQVLGVLGGLAIRVLVVNRGLDLAQLVGASLFPALIGAPAKVASPRRDALRMEPGLLIERNDVGGVRGAKDMAAVAAVVAAQEDTEGRTAGGGVTARRSRVRLEGRLVTVILLSFLASAGRCRDQ